MPAKHPPMPGTLAAYAESGRPVFLVCNHCGRFTVVRFYQIAQRTGWRAMVRDVALRMRCSRCNQRGARFTSIRPVGRPG